MFKTGEFVTSNSYNKSVVTKERKMGENVSTSQASYNNFSGASDHTAYEINKAKANRGGDWWGDNEVATQYKHTHMNVKDEDYQHRSAAAAESQQSATDFSMDNRRRRQLPSHENPSMQYNIITGTMTTKVHSEKPKFGFRDQLPSSSVSQPPYATY